MTSGAGDLAAIGLAVSGLVFVGPIELFRPETATADLGDAIWLLMLGLYWLSLLLVMLISRPRLVIYNMTAEQLRPLLADAVAEVDPDARWAGDSLILPRLGVQLHLDLFGPMRHASLVSSGGEQDLDGWWKLRKALGRSLSAAKVRPTSWGYGFVVWSILLLGSCLLIMASSPAKVAQSIGEIFAF